MIISQSTDLGGMVYPFLERHGRSWYIRTWPVNAPDPMSQGRPLPTLRWVKDDKVCDLYVQDTDTATFLDSSGLQLSLHNGPYVLSKRLSRLMRPFRFHRFFAPDEITIAHDPDRDPATWDGAGLVARRVLDRLAASLDPDHPHYDLHCRELAQTRRFELTLMHSGGQEKGHVLVVDDLPTDFVFPAGSAKTEVALADAVFVGLHPVHARDEMRLDVQSLVNLHPFFHPEHLLAWMSQESELFLKSIRSGRLDAVLSRLGRFAAPGDLSQFRNWWLGEYLACGGSLMWFPGTVRAMGRQHLNRLRAGARKLRFPVPGGRYYIFPAAVGRRDVGRGQVRLEPRTATAWVNSDDWNDYIVETLGGCDGDDGVWVVPFTDRADDRRKLLLWRSPNQLGEYVLLQPTADSHEIVWPTAARPVAWPRLDSRDLPPRIDRVAYTYGELPRFAAAPAPDYTVFAVQPAIDQARTNKGTLGAYCNMLLLIKALYGRLPTDLPARLEDVIDGSVKSARDLSPVLTWVDWAAHRILAAGTPVPQALRPRIDASLLPQEQRRLPLSSDHWIDTLLNAAAHHSATYAANLDALAAAATPPAALFTHGHAWRTAGNGLRTLYAQGIRRRLGFPTIAAQCADYLAAWNGNHRHVLLGAAVAALSDAARSDAVLWQDGIVHHFLQVLRDLGILGETIWTQDGAYRYYGNDELPTAVPLRLNGVWFNYLTARGHDFARMSDVPTDLRHRAKQHVASLDWRDFELRTAVTDDDRVITHTERGNLFAYVQTGQELRAARAGHWRILHATARDGNLAAVLTPA